MALTDITLREAKPKEKAYKLTDAGGLYLWIAPTGLKSWRMKYRFQGKEKILTIGKYPQTSLKQARNARADAKALLSEGIDPSAHKQAIKHSASDQSATTFKDAAIRWHELNTPRWTPRYALKV